MENLNFLVIKEMFLAETFPSL